MICFHCGRKMDKPAGWIGGQPIGPKCLEQVGGTGPLRFKRMAPDNTESEQQPDLFNDGETDSDHQTNNR